jgi:hypothetical protein
MSRFNPNARRVIDGRKYEVEDHGYILNGVPCWPVTRRRDVGNCWAFEGRVSVPRTFSSWRKVVDFVDETIEAEIE